MYCEYIVWFICLYHRYMVFYWKNKISKLWKIPNFTVQIMWKTQAKIGSFFLWPVMRLKFGTPLRFWKRKCFKKYDSSNLFFYISKFFFNILRQSARTIGTARQKSKIPQKSTTVNFDRAPKIFEPKNLQAYAIIIKKYCARTYNPARAFWHRKK